MAVKRRTTSQVRVFERAGAEAVKYDVSRSDCVTITVPLSSKWTSGPHWHETHTEYLQVLEGRASVTLGGRSREYGPHDGVIQVPMFTVHEWHRVWDSRANPNDEDDGDLIVREWTAPEDGQKEVFFRMLNSFLTEPHPSSLYEIPSSNILRPAMRITKGFIERWIVTLQLFAIFRAWDNWPVLVGPSNGYFSRLATHVVLGFCSSVGRYMLGLGGLYGEYVDEDLIAKTERSKNETSQKGRKGR